MIHNFSFADSTMLSSCSYDDSEKELTVTFKSSGKQYTYVDVPDSTFVELTEAKSPGRFFNSIKSGLKQK